jgi:ketosteroid isomerase-like protein
MIRPVVAAFVVALMVAGCGGGSKSGGGAVMTTPFADAEVTDVLRAVEQWRQASEQRSINALFALYDHGKQTTLVTQGQAFIGWDAVANELTSRFAAAKEVSYKLTDISVAPIGAGAVATGQLVRELSDGVKTVNDRGTLTMALAKNADGAWLIVSEHFSIRPM